MQMTVQVVTPAGILFETKDATFVAASGEGGDLGVETNHSNLLTTLRIGPLRVRLEDFFSLARAQVFGRTDPQVKALVADKVEPAHEPANPYM